MWNAQFFPKLSKIFESYSHTTYDVSQVSLDFTQQFFEFLGKCFKVMKPCHPRVNSHWQPFFDNVNHGFHDNMANLLCQPWPQIKKTWSKYCWLLSTMSTIGSFDL